MPSRAGVFRRPLLTGAIALSLATPRAGFAEEPAASPVLSWETGEVTVRMYGPHAIGIQYLVSTRDAGVPGQRDRHQQV